MQPKFVIDVNNVVFTRRNGTSKRAQLQRLIKLIQVVESMGEVYPVVSTELKYRIDEYKRLKSLIEQGKILEMPVNTDNDEYILELARQLDAFIISNDRFRQYRYKLIVYNQEGLICPILPWIHVLKEEKGC